MTNSIALPDGWTWSTLGQGTNPMQKRVDPQDFPDLPYIGMENVEAHTMRLLTTVPARLMKSTADTFSPGDVLYGRLRPYLNKVFCPDFEGLCSTEFIVFRKVPHLNSKFLQYFLNSWEFATFSNGLNAGDRPRVKFDQLKYYPFPIPPLSVQECIVAKIEALFTQLDAGTAALKRVQAGLKRYKASVLKAAVEGRLVPQDPSDEPAEEWRHHKGKTQIIDDDLPVLPSGWYWTRVKHIGEVVTGTTPSKEKIEYYGDEYPLFKPTDLDAGYYTKEYRDSLSLLGIQKARLLPAKSVLVTCIGATIGKTGLIRINGATNQQINAIVPSKFIDPEFLYFVCIAPQFYKSVLDNSSATTLPIISKKKFEELKIPLPPLTEQRKIVIEIEHRLSLVAAVVKTVEEGLARATRLRQAILKQAFEGKL